MNLLIFGAYKRIPIIKSWFLHADKKGQNQNNGASPFKDYLNLKKCTGLAYKTVYIIKYSNSNVHTPVVDFLRSTCRWH